MNNFLKAMLRGGKKEVWTQVDEAELAWSTKHLYNENELKIEERDLNELDVGGINIKKEVKVGL